MANAFHWHLRAEECLKANGIESGHEAFTRLYIRYADPISGEEGVVRADNQVAGYPLLERIVPRTPPGVPLTKTEAQELADEAAAVLGGKPVARHWVQIASDRALICSDGRKRPAKLIEAGDRIIATLLLEQETLYVFGVTNESDGTVLVSLSDSDNHDRRLDLDLTLNGFEHN